MSPTFLIPHGFPAFALPAFPSKCLHIVAEGTCLKEQLTTAAQGKLFNGTSGCGQLRFLGFPYSIDLCSSKHDLWTLLGPQESFRGSARSKLFS